jgi:phage gpG-like protein
MLYSKLHNISTKKYQLMPNILDGQQLENNILKDMRVELAEEFDKNFNRKAFFSDAWKPRKNKKALGSLLVVSGAMRRSIKSEVVDHGVRFSSSLPYTAIHNEGGQGTLSVKAHYRTRNGKRYKVKAHLRRFNMPQRQFIGDGKETWQLIKNVIEDNLQQFSLSLSQFISNNAKTNL